MIKTKKSKNKRIGLILCSLFICLCSVLCIVPFNNKQIVVKADSIVSDVVFSSSNLIVPTARYTYKYVNGNRVDSTPFNYRGYDSYFNFGYLYTMFSVKFRYNQDTGNLQFAPTFYSLDLSTNGLIDDNGVTVTQEYVYYNFVNRSYSSYIYSLNGSYSNVSDYDGNIDILVANSSGLSYFPNDNSEVTGIVFELSTSSVDIDISKIAYMTISLESNPIGRSRYIVTYYDSLANFVQFKFACGSWRDSIPTRTYYFNTGNFTDNEWYDQGYQQGQQAGYNTGYSAGETAGYNAGYSVGNNVGYNNGFSAGVEDSNQYTFLNLLSATIDAPVKYFQSLFNFELLGVNLQGFLTGLFTLCVIVTIVKLCLGG